MDREIPVANRFIDKKMQEFRSRKHRQTLSQIRNKANSTFQSSMYQQTPKHNRYSSSYLENKNLQIEKQNIKLFNKIASIIREKPKPGSNGSSYAQTCQQASLKHKKRLQRIKTQNEALQKRISQQKPTIQNKQFFKDRMKNIKYLKLIGRFPYEDLKKNEGMQTPNQHSIRTLTEYQPATDIEIYRKKTEQFFVRIVKISNNFFVFNVQAEENDKNYQYTMSKQTYEQQFMRCGYNYDRLIQQLRLNENQQITFQMLQEQQEPI